MRYYFHAIQIPHVSSALLETNTLLLLSTLTDSDQNESHVDGNLEPTAVQQGCLEKPLAPDSFFISEVCVASSGLHCRKEKKEEMEMES